MKVFTFYSYSETDSEILTNVFDSEEKAMGKMNEFREFIEENDFVETNTNSYVCYYKNGYKYIFAYREQEFE